MKLTPYVCRITQFSLSGHLWRYTNLMHKLMFKTACSFPVWNNSCYLLRCSVQWAGKLCRSVGAWLWLCFQNIVKLHELCPFHLWQHAYACQDLALFCQSRQNQKSPGRTDRHAYCYQQPTSTVWRIHKQETGAKEALNWNILANVWKSAFWFYYFVHFSRKWLCL